MRILDTRVTPAGPGLFTITTTVEIGQDLVHHDEEVLGEGPIGDAIPDRIVQALIDRSPEPMSLAQIQEVVGGNPGTINRQAWTLATNAPDLQLSLRGWVMNAGRGKYGLSPAARRLLESNAHIATTHGEDSLAIQELMDGVAFWRSRRTWPTDFHNADYKRWNQQNPHGNFTMDWWRPFLKTLQGWIATRPTSGRVLTERFQESIPALAEAWLSSCEPFLDCDVSSVTWEQVMSFPNAVGAIKPTLNPSPVFTSKFCHFLLPSVFPVVDNEALGNSWPSYEAYFRFVQDEWASTAPSTQTALVQGLTSMIESTGSDVFPGFPLVNKIVELRLIGRRHPSGR